MADGVPLAEALFWFATDRLQVARVRSLDLLHKEKVQLSEDRLCELVDGLLLLKEELLRKLGGGELVGRGYPVPAPLSGPVTSMEEAPPAFWVSAAVDWVQGSAAAHGRELQGILVFEGSLFRRKARRSKYEDADAPLITEIQRLVETGMQPFPAAQSLAGRAEGGGTLDSKAKRLYDRFAQSRSSTQF